MNSRQKGASGEREITTLLNKILLEEMIKCGNFSNADMSNKQNFVQRNQNQSAVGGCDLMNTFGFAIEIKRVQELAVKKWWEQTVKSAEDRKEIPVLLYRQNNKPWRCMIELPLSNKLIPAEIDLEYFLEMFRYKVALNFSSLSLKQVS